MATQDQEHQPAAARVLYIGHLPHGFYEDPLRKFFSQFGTVTNLRLSRNKSTGKSKHYAFLEFQSPEVAAIAAEAMDGYFMFKHKLVCQLVAPGKVHEELWKGGNAKFRPPPRQKLERLRLEKPRTPAELERLAERSKRRDAELRSKLAAAGIEYDWPVPGSTEPAPAEEPRKKRKLRAEQPVQPEQQAPAEAVPQKQPKTQRKAAAEPASEQTVAAQQPSKQQPEDAEQLPAVPAKQRKRAKAPSFQPAPAEQQLAEPEQAPADPAPRQRKQRKGQTQQQPAPPQKRPKKSKAALGPAPAATLLSMQQTKGAKPQKAKRALKQ